MAETTPPISPTSPPAPAVAVSRTHLLQRVFEVLGGFGFATVILVFLLFLTFFGTIYQVENGIYESQRRYFDSLFVVHWIRGLPLPLPGAALLLSLLGINVLIGGVVRIRKAKATIGILIAHVGILFLLFSGLVKTFTREYGRVTLFEGQSAREFVSYHDWEVVILEPLDSGNTREHIIPWAQLSGLDAGHAVTFTSAALPFDITVTGFGRNTQLRRAAPHGGDGIDGFALEQLPPDKEPERNVPGFRAALRDKASGARQEAIVWGQQRLPWVVEAGGRRFGVDLRHEQFPLPFTIRLDDTERELYPGTMKPKRFESEVTVTDGADRYSQRIKMNEPLRARGLVFYQSGWDTIDGREVSTLAVADDPSDAWPLIACLVIALGLVIHFSMRLTKYIRSETKKTARAAA